ncbi:hypothetical protein FZI85_07875 [Mycobacterium sp. CBMA293]|uniref:hypothetical protein n=1 Tax=unclassified Mycolicibacterium TaxID=2636767 RepID=UPI0012DC88A8|nr:MULTISPECIES: hypothetical protein [unclassified Mycolicibacterium]MUL46483.1 hypothetical protein [Mycolicibacterium sp. CBMA 360]MUL57005.1 hypothetical protein [Mycolicibacterium sp. CBMA 335]MUL70045.1 hypothetical protein [Mycolicibacterium sp. CBMA 311]MUL92093.1 hypothetical protein [Mycolicibacterium sp. CBMA 230]MUM10949.1 hypothetical protein [Mycolicibacterium sp. CBMA 293]
MPRAALDVLWKVIYFSPAGRRKLFEALGGDLSETTLRPAQPTPQSSPDPGREWSSFIEKELERQHERRGRLNTRASTAVTSATTIMTVSLAVVAVLKGRQFAVTGVLQFGSLLAAFVLLLVGAVLSILAGATGGDVGAPEINDMKQMVCDPLWCTDDRDQRNYTAQLNLRAIRSLRAGNFIKYRFLVLSLFTQALGLSFLGVFALAIATD